jgi:hypothetical protein
MFKKLGLLLMTLIFLEAKNFAQRANHLFGGVNFSTPVVPANANKAIGYGLEIKGEHFFSPKFSMNLSIGYTHFKGSITYGDDSKDNSFALIPCSVGVKYYIKNFYLAAGAGLAVKASRNTGTNRMLYPAIGFAKKPFDISIQLIGVPQTFPSIPESTFLLKGGYSYLGVHINYLLLK